MQKIHVGIVTQYGGDFQLPKLHDYICDKESHRLLRVWDCRKFNYIYYEPMDNYHRNRVKFEWKYK